VTGSDELRGEALLDHLRVIFHQTPLHALLGFQFHETPASEPGEPGVVRVSMPVRDEAFNASGNLHGGAIATLVDVAAGSCAARASGFDPVTQSLVTADLHVRYLGRPKGDTITAEARLMRAGRMLIVVEIRVTDPPGNVIAFADFSSMVVPRREPLDAAAGSDPRSPDL
jgi:uncharacterized protein (TIGR00369 family)